MNKIRNLGTIISCIGMLAWVLGMIADTNAKNYVISFSYTVGVYLIAIGFLLVVLPVSGRSKDTSTKMGRYISFSLIGFVVFTSVIMGFFSIIIYYNKNSEAYDALCLRTHKELEGDLKFGPVVTGNFDIKFDAHDSSRACYKFSVYRNEESYRVEGCAYGVNKKWEVESFSLNQ